MNNSSFRGEDNIRHVLDVTPTLGERVMVDPTAVVMGEIKSDREDPVDRIRELKTGPREDRSRMKPGSNQGKSLGGLS